MFAALYLHAPLRDCRVHAGHGITHVGERTTGAHNYVYDGQVQTIFEFQFWCRKHRTSFKRYRAARNTLARLAASTFGGLQVNFPTADVCLSAACTRKKVYCMLTRRCTAVTAKSCRRFV